MHIIIYNIAFKLNSLNKTLSINIAKPRGICDDNKI